jgi:hypothetical protein
MARPKGSKNLEFTEDQKRDLISRYLAGVEPSVLREEMQRRGDLRRRNGITLEQYNELLERQGGGCAICGKLSSEEYNGKFLHVDHDHKTGKVRGLLCNDHNHGLGQFHDDPVLLRRAADYLERPQSSRHGR